MVILKILRTRSDVLYFVLATTLFAFLVLSVIIASFFRDVPFLATSLAWFIYFRHYVYTQIDYLFNLTFFKEGNRLFVRFMGIKLRLSYDKSFLIIEEGGVFRGRRNGPIITFGWSGTMIPGHSNY